MSRSLLSKQLRHTSGPSYRTFRSPPRRTYSNPVDTIASYAYEFHHFFESVHDSTGLPWLYSIPLVTWLFRVPLTASRFYFASCRRDQHLAIPELKFHARVVEEQGALARRARVGSDEKIAKWEAQQWENRRLSVHRKFKRAEPNGFMSVETNFDMTNVGVWVITAVNMSTLLVACLNNPELSQFHVVAFDIPQFVPIWLSFSALAFLNTEYYHDYPSSQGAGSQKATFWAKLDLFRWEWTYVPVTAYFCLFSCPHPIILSAMSNTAYTFFERKAVDLFFDTPGADLRKGPRGAIQIRNMIPQRTSR